MSRAKSCVQSVEEWVMLLKIVHSPRMFGCCFNFALLFVTALANLNKRNDNKVLQQSQNTGFS